MLFWWNTEWPHKPTKLEAIEMKMEIPDFCVLFPVWIIFAFKSKGRKSDEQSQKTKHVYPLEVIAPD